MAHGQTDEWMTLGKLAKKLKRNYRTLLQWVELGRRAHATGERIRLRVRQNGGFLESTLALYEEFNARLNEGLE